MKTNPDDKFEKEKQAIRQKMENLKNQMKATQAAQQRDHRKSRARLCFLLGEVLVLWSENGVAEKRVVIDTVAAGVEAGKRELALRLLKEVSPKTVA